MLRKAFVPGTESQHPRAGLFLDDETSTYLEGALRLHGQQVPVEGYQVEAVLLSVDEGPQHALLLQPLLAEQAAARHEEDVEVPLRRAASVFPARVTSRDTADSNSAAQSGTGWGLRGAEFKRKRNATCGYYDQLPFYL